MLSRLRRGARQLLASTPARPRPSSPSPLVLPQVSDLVQEAFGPCPAGPILYVDRCPVCGSPDATQNVCRYNKFITYEHIPDAACAVSDFALCHACGVVYATRRPDPYPSVFGFHEVFHVLVIAAVACQYAAVAFFVLPDN